jgi:TonB family protein
MREVPTPPLEKIEPTFPEPRLLVVPEAWSRIFLQNLWGLFHSREGAPLHLESAPGAFWSDVFIERKLPWRRFLESGGYHILALIVVWAGPRFLALQPNVTAQPTFRHADVVYYTPSEYLPPLDTLRSTSTQAEKADPEFSAQPIISVPPEADNHSQTIVTAPKIQLQHDLPLPNTVAWSDKPLMPIAPAPLVPASEITRLAPQMDRSVIAPPPDVDNASQKTMQLPRVSVIAPPPALEATSDRRLGELNVGHSTVIAPAPQLYLDEQRTVAQGRSAALRGHAPQVIAPPPSVNAPGGSRNGGGMIALSLHPAVGAPPAPVAGNRRGNFAATPEGHRGASGAPGGSTASSAIDGSASGKNSTGKLPSGLYVGKTTNPTSPIAGDPTPTTSSANSVNPNLLAGVRPPRLSRTAQPESDSKISEAERAVFGDRKIYSLSLNMPNLNSAGGSWVIRFAALKQDSSPGNSSTNLAPSELSSPVAKRKVDPAYPLELMRQNVAGTVILYGVIHSDGTVGNVRVLRSVDDRLDQFASEAIAKCQFEPAMKNGSPVDVEATFWIPFRPARAKSNF